MFYDEIILIINAILMLWGDLVWFYYISINNFDAFFFWVYIILFLLCDENWN